MKPRTALLVIFVLSILAASLDAAAAPRWLRLSWTGTDVTDSTMTVAWNDSVAGPGSVQYRDAVGGAAREAAATAADTTSDRLDVTYEAVMTGLLPFTVYEYRVSSGGAWSGWKRFTTPPAVGSCGHLRMVLGGDGRGGEAFWDPGYVSRHWGAIAGFIKAEGPLLVAHTGDIVHDGNHEEQWEEWFGVSEPLTSSVPFLPVFGNHDDGPGEGDGQWYNRMYALPKAGAGELSSSVDPDGDGVEDAWAVVVGNALLVGLSTEGIGAPVQLGFLERTIAAWDARVDWKLVFFHRPLWSSGGHGNNDGDALDAADLITIIDDYGVDFVVCGHDHDYERSHPSKGGYGGRPRVVTPLPLDGGDSGVAEGTIHITAGGLGAFTNFVMVCRAEGCFRTSPNLHYLLLDIEADRADGIVRDLGPILTLSTASLRPDPIDTFTVYKRSTVCATPPADDEGPEEADVPEEVDATEPLPEAGEPDAAAPDDEADADEAVPDGAADLPFADGGEDATPPGVDGEGGCSCRAVG